MKTFMKFLCKVSFIAHLCTLKEKIADGSIELAGEILGNKDGYKKRGERILSDVEALEKKVDDNSNNIQRAPKYSMQSFVSISSHNEQVSVLNNALKNMSNNKIQGDSASQTISEYKSWDDQMLYIVQIKKCSVPKSNVKTVAKLLEIDPKTLKMWLKFGHEIERLTEEQAELLYDIFAYHGIKSCYSLMRIDKKIKEIHEKYLSESELEKVYWKTTLGKAVLFAVAVGLFFVIPCLFDFSMIWLPFLLAAIVFGLTYLIQKILSFAIVPLANFIVSKIMSKIEIKYNMAVSDLVYREFDYYKDLSKTIASKIDSINTKISKNTSDSNVYIYGFFSKKLPIQIFSFVVDQMRTGANYSEACWRAEQALSQEKWKEEMRKHQEASAKEEEKWRAQVLESQKRVEEYRREQAYAARAAAYQLEQRNWEIRENTNAYKECKDEMRKLRYEITSGNN